MSGELLTNETTDGIVTTAQSSFMENVFNYFGNVTFLFPLVFVFIGYKLFIKKIALKEIDFFVIGLFILGFNILVIGLCSLFVLGKIFFFSPKAGSEPDEKEVLLKRSLVVFSSAFFFVEKSRLVWNGSFNSPFLVSSLILPESSSVKLY